MSGKISQYTEALSVANDDFFDVSIDTGGGVYATRKVRKSNLGIGGNFADSDLTFTGNRIHDLNDFNLTFENPTDDAVNSSKILHEWNFFSLGTLRDLVSYSDSSHVTGVKIKGGGQFGLYMENGGNTIARMYRLGSVGILSLENSGTSGVYFNGADSNASYVAGYLNVGYLSISNPASLSVKGKNSTSATTTALFENDSGTELMRIYDDGKFHLANTHTVLYSEAGTNGRNSMGMGQAIRTDSHFAVRNASSRSYGLTVEDSSGNVNAQFGSISLLSHVASQDYHLFQGGSIVKFEQYSNGSNIMAFRSNGTSFMSGYFKIGGTTRDSSSALDIESTTQGFLPPRMTTTQKNAISTPATGLVVYDSTLNKLCVYTGASWETVTSS